MISNNIASEYLQLCSRTSYYKKPRSLCWRGISEVAITITTFSKRVRPATAMEEVKTKNVETLAYVVHGAGEPFKLEQVTLDELAADELLVDIEYSGICATDLGFQAGKIKLCPYPAIFGHEGAGKILAIGEKVQNKDWKVGDRVLLSMNYCQKCKFCRSDHPADCVEGTRLHLFGLRDNGTTAAKLNGADVRFHFFGQSSFAKRSFVHETCVVKVPDGVKDEDIASLAAMGCGYQTGIFEPSHDLDRK